MVGSKRRPSVVKDDNNLIHRLGVISRSTQAVMFDVYVRSDGRLVLVKTVIGVVLCVSGSNFSHVVIGELDHFMNANGFSMV